MAATDFWQRLVNDGVIQGDPSYYSEGRASEAEISHAIDVGLATNREAFVQAAFDEGLAEGQASYWLSTPPEGDANLYAAVTRNSTEVGGATPTAAPVGGGSLPPTSNRDQFPGVMQGGTIRRVQNNAGQDDFYIMEYEYPKGSGHSFYYRYPSLEALEQAIGPNMGSGVIPVGSAISENDLTGWTDGGDANELLGVNGTFDGFMDDIIRETGIAAGIDDPSLVGRAVADPAIAMILAKAVTGDWTELQTKAAMRKTDFYKDVLHPGIENFYGQSENPEALYAMYKQNVEASLKRLGIPQDAQGGYGTQLASLLDKGVTDAGFANFASIYQQAQSNVGFAGSLSKWTERYTGQAIGSFEDYFDVLAGNAPAEVLEIAEVAGLQFMAENSGFDITDQELQNLSEATDISQEKAGVLFSNTARALLALGERGLRRGSLSSNQILEAEAGIGGNVEKTKLLMSKLAREEGISDDPTATIFTDFNREGAPIKKGLGSTISEGA